MILRESDSKVNLVESDTISPLSSTSLEMTRAILTSSLWNKKRAIDAIDQTYELDKTLDVWNDRAVCPPYPSYAKLTSQHLILVELLHQTHLYACSGGVWTETSDVEGEVNGLVT
jgi:hypothetical protein